jgi:hypothetical protein
VISYTVYKLVHYLGIFATVALLGAALGRGAANASADGTPSGGGSSVGARDPWRRRFNVLHGIGLFVILLGGFGMLARLGITQGLGLPGWIWAKLAIWTVFVGLIVVARRTASAAARALIVLPLLAALAGYIAFTKPF